MIRTLVITMFICLSFGFRIEQELKFLEENNPTLKTLQKKILIEDYKEKAISSKFLPRVYSNLRSSYNKNNPHKDNGSTVPSYVEPQYEAIYKSLMLPSNSESFTQQVRFGVEQLLLDSGKITALKNKANLNKQLMGNEYNLSLNKLKFDLKMEYYTLAITQSKLNEAIKTNTLAITEEKQAKQNLNDKSISITEFNKIKINKLKTNFQKEEAIRQTQMQINKIKSMLGTETTPNLLENWVVNITPKNIFPSQETYTEKYQQQKHWLKKQLLAQQIKEFKSQNNPSAKLYIETSYQQSNENFSDSLKNINNTCQAWIDIRWNMCDFGETDNQIKATELEIQILDIKHFEQQLNIAQKISDLKDQLKNLEIKQGYLNLEKEIAQNNLENVQEGYKKKNISLFDLKKATIQYEIKFEQLFRTKLKKTIIKEKIAYYENL